MLVVQSRQPFGPVYVVWSLSLALLSRNHAMLDMAPVEASSEYTINADVTRFASISESIFLW